MLHRGTAQLMYSDRISRLLYSVRDVYQYTLLTGVALDPSGPDKSIKSEYKI